MTVLKRIMMQLTAPEKWKQQQRNLLLDYLRMANPEHSQAENLVLAFIDDKEVTQAWIAASRNWKNESCRYCYLPTRQQPQPQQKILEK